MKLLLKTFLTASAPAVAIGLNRFLVSKYPSVEPILLLIASVLVGSFVALFLSYLLLEVPMNFSLLRKFFDDRYPLEGIWLQTVPQMPNSPVSIAIIEYSRENKKYYFRGVNYLSTGEPSGWWKTSYFDFNSERERVEFAYHAKVFDKPKPDQPAHSEVFGAGYLDFVISGKQTSTATGTYHDVSFGNETSKITMERITKQKLKQILGRRTCKVCTDEEMKTIAITFYNERTENSTN